MFTGYIIKFYRHINREKYTADNSKFDFMCFGCFDNIKITTVEDLTSYQSKNFDIQDSSSNNTFLFRQKILAYDIENNNKRIFEKDAKNPLIAILVIDYKSANSLDIKKYNDYFERIIDKLSLEGLKYKILETFTLGRFIIVCRSNSFYKINKFLAAARRIPQVLSSYSVLGMVCDKISFENIVDEQINATMKIRVKPNFALNEINKCIDEHFLLSTEDKSEIFVLKDKKILTPGKYDISLDFYTHDKLAFFELFNTNDLYHIELKKSKVILETETEIYSYINDEEYEIIEELATVLSSKKVTVPDELIKLKVIDDGSKKYDSLKKYWESLLYKVKSSRISEDYKSEIERLFLRSVQLIFEYCSKGSFKYCKDIIDGIGSFLELTLITISKVFRESDNPEYTKEYGYYFYSITEGTESLNVLLDNRDINDCYDFESPHSNVMFTIPISKLVQFYSEFSREILKFLNKIDYDKKISIFVTVNGCSKITIHRLFINCKEDMLLNIRIPVELLYHPFYTLAFITHELGHYSSVGVDNCVRNQYFLASVIQSLSYSLQSCNGYRMFDQNSALFIISNTICSDKEYEKDGDVFLQNLKFSLNEVLYYSTSGRIVETDRNIQSFFGEFCQIVDYIFNSYNEAVADAFMLSVLNINDPKQYIEIVSHYLNHMGILQNDLSGNLILRFVAVLSNMIDKNENVDSAEKLSDVLIDWIENEINESDSNKMLYITLAEMVKQPYFCAICYPLFCLLKHYTFKTLKQAIKKDLKSENQYNDLLKKYKSISPDMENISKSPDMENISKNFIDFIHYICNNVKDNNI